MGFAALAVTGALAETSAFSIQLVSTFDYPGTGNQTRPQKINTKGDIAGVFLDSNGISFAFARFFNGTFTSPISDPNDAAGLTEGRGINDSRTMCGDYTDSAGAFEGFLLNLKTNHFTNFAPEPTFTIVLGINNAGDFCGSEIPSATGIQSGFTYIGGVLQDFTVNNATATLAYQINNGNTTCGYYIDGTDGLTHGYYRDPDGRIHAKIDPAGSTGTIVFGNNDVNYIVGRYADAGGLTHGFLFLPAKKKFILYDFPGSTFTSLNGINNGNMICGRYTDASGFDHGIIARLVQGHDSPVVPLASGSEQIRALPQQHPANTNPAY